MQAEDPYDLTRFLEAQHRCYTRVLEELAAGAKTSHWMWFIFPQLRGLGASATARRFGLSGLEEARAYLAHPILGARLRECARGVLAVEARSAHQIFGSPDDLKLRSCLTLFAAAASPSPEDQVFSAALARYYGGEPDPLTVQLLAHS
ncbi:MAG TPA: DUF1810 domain-containing protein [Burkholderiales bacterium]|nr:DUF1810 domain-containing protein [Burkholderiales bacterium]HYA47757.1 DUF1810 domain-containing protein [Burkholderiales bacterium]